MAASMLLAASALLFSHVAGWSVDFPPLATNVSISIEKVSIPGPGALDAPKFNVTANKTSADWWYFDAVSTIPGDESTVEIVFFNDPDIASQPLAVQVAGLFPNGTKFQKTTTADGGATVTVDEKGVQGQWKGTGANFSSTPLEEPELTYTIHLNSPELNVYGTFILKATGTPHYPCGPMLPGVTEALLPTFFWANAIPDADPVVDLTIDGFPLKINEGFGYHDKNWAEVGVSQYAKFWNWGHARFGPYAVVWFNPLDYDDVEHSHAYVLENGNNTLISCEPGVSQVRQWGVNATWPPTTGLNNVDGVEARFNLTTGEVLVANLTKHILVIDEVVHHRANGPVQGGIEGGEMFDGYAHFEEYAWGVLLG